MTTTLPFDLPEGAVILWYDAKQDKIGYQSPLSSRQFFYSATPTGLDELFRIMRRLASYPSIDPSIVEQETKARSLALTPEQLSRAIKAAPPKRHATSSELLDIAANLDLDD